MLFFNIIKLRAGLSLFHLIILSFILGPPVEVIVDATILSITSLDAINMVPLTFSPLFILSLKKCSKFSEHHFLETCLGGFFRDILFYGEKMIPEIKVMFEVR